MKNLETVATVSVSLILAGIIMAATTLFGVNSTIYIRIMGGVGIAGIIGIIFYYGFYHVLQDANSIGDFLITFVIMGILFFFGDLAGRCLFTPTHLGLKQLYLTWFMAIAPAAYLIGRYYWWYKIGRFNRNSVPWWFMGNPNKRIAKVGPGEKKEYF